MEVKANNNIDVAQRVLVSPTRSRPPRLESDTASFSRVAALDQALRATPTVRPEVIARAKDLVADVKYPPTAAIAGIAALLALKLDPGADS